MTSLTTSSRLVFATFLAVLAGCTAKPEAGGATGKGAGTFSDDAAVVLAVLQDFAESPSARNADKSTLFVVPAESNPVSADWIEWLSSHPGQTCGDFSRYRNALRSRASGVLDLAPLIPESNSWRIATAEESELHVIELSQRKIANRLLLSAPAYATDGSSALVHISFLWSIHAATGEVIVTKEEAGWRVTCRDVLYTL